jgi:hypothetical protein
VRPDLVVCQRERHPVVIARDKLVRLMPKRAITGLGGPSNVARKTGTSSVGATFGLKAKFSRVRGCRRRGNHS